MAAESAPGRLDADDIVPLFLQVCTRGTAKLPGKSTEVIGEISWPAAARRSDDPKIAAALYKVGTKHGRAYIGIFEGNAAGGKQRLCRVASQNVTFDAALTGVGLKPSPADPRYPINPFGPRLQVASYGEGIIVQIWSPGGSLTVLDTVSGAGDAVDERLGACKFSPSSPACIAELKDKRKDNR